MGHVDVEVDGAGQEVLQILSEVVSGDEGDLGLAQDLGHVLGHQDHQGISCIFFLQLGHQVPSYRQVLARFGDDLDNIDVRTFDGDKIGCFYILPVDQDILLVSIHFDLFDEVFVGYSVAGFFAFLDNFFNNFGLVVLVVVSEQEGEALRFSFMFYRQV